jgi:hypothetical protein
MVVVVIRYLGDDSVVALLSGVDSYAAFFLNHAVRGLLGLVLLFDLYAIRRIRREHADELYTLSVIDPAYRSFQSSLC